MKLTIPSLTFITATSAWTMQFDCPRGSGYARSFSGSGNKGCTYLPTCASGDKIVWANPSSSNCVLRLYGAEPCSASQEVGSSHDNWTKTLTRQIGAWGVTNC